MGEGDKTEWLRFTIPPPAPPFTSLPATLTLTIECQVDPDTEDIVDVVFDAIQLGTASGPSGTSAATAVPIPATDTLMVYQVPTDGITLANLNAGDARVFIGCKTLPETPYATSDFAITYDCEGSGRSIGTSQPEVITPWVNPTPPSTPLFAASVDQAQTGDRFMEAELGGAVDINVDTVTSLTYAIVELTSSAIGNAGAGYLIATVSSDNGIGTTPTGTEANSVSTETKKFKVRMTAGHGEKTLSVSAYGRCDFDDSQLPGEPSAGTEYSLSADIVLPGDATVKIDFVKLTTPTQGSGGGDGGDVGSIGVKALAEMPIFGTAAVQVRVGR